jgi:diguanylate cyclase (GGDEF)-like protein/PAS domain S-box-containing protein
MLSAELMKAVMTATNDGVVVAEITENTTSITYANPMFLQLTSSTLEGVVGRECLFPLRHSLDTELLQRFSDALQNKQDYESRLRLQTTSGKRTWVVLRIIFFHSSHGSSVICFYKDVTQEEYVKSVLDKVNILYREMSKRLEYTNETDHLTRLKNRSHLCTRGEFMLGAAKRGKLRLHAISIAVNSSHFLASSGDPVLGDDRLIQIAGVIRQYFCRATDIAIRMGDDEFAIICIEDDDHQVHDRAQALQQDIQALPFKDASGHRHEIDVNIGIYSITPEKHTTIEGMMQKAGELIFDVSNSGQIIHTQIGEEIHSPHQ